MAQIDDEFQKLLQFFSSPEAQKMKVEDAVKIIMDFFEKLKSHIEHASPEEKTALINRMGQMYRQLLDATKQITEKMHLSEKDLAAYAENPNNFTPEQWRAMQEAKKMLASFSGALAQEGKPGAPIPKKEGKPKKKSDRSKWMRS